MNTTYTFWTPCCPRSNLESTEGPHLCLCPQPFPAAALCTRLGGWQGAFQVSKCKPNLSIRHLSGGTFLGRPPRDTRQHTVTSALSPLVPLAAPQRGVLSPAFSRQPATCNLHHPSLCGCQGFLAAGPSGCDPTHRATSALPGPPRP